MSFRGSFTSEYIYDEDDYIKIRNILESKGQNSALCVAPPPSYGTNVLRIISGKCASCVVDMEYEVLEDLLQGIETNDPITFIVICDNGLPIIKLIKNEEGNVEICKMEENEK